MQLANLIFILYFLLLIKKQKIKCYLSCANTFH